MKIVIANELLKEWVLMSSDAEHHQSTMIHEDFLSNVANVAVLNFYFAGTESE